MKSLIWRKRFVGAALALGVLGVGLAVADDKPAEKSNPEKQEKTVREAIRNVRVVAAIVGKHWIGVHAMPVTDEALKSQLNLQDRLIVIQVLPDSPSAKAGLKQHDILLKFGDQELHSLDDLIKAVGENGDKEAKLLVLRGGKEQALVIAPTERPSDDVVAKIHEVQPQDFRVLLEHGIKLPTDEQGRIVIMGPGVAAGAFAKAAAFPDGLSISVSKENDQPAKIVAKKDGKTYETTGDKLGELPEDIRVHVERLLHGPQALNLKGDAWKTLLQHHDPKINEKVREAIESAKKSASEAQSRTERIEIRRTDGGPLESLRKEIESLRKDIEKLKGDNKEPRDESREKKSD